jgi:hypothetical protein
MAAVEVEAPYRGMTLVGDEVHSRHLEYARGLVDLIAEDARQVYVRVTAAVGLAALFVTQLPFHRILALATWERWVLMLGLAAAVGSGALLFYYSGRLHRARVEMLRAIRDGKPESVPRIWELGGQVWERSRWAYRGGIAMLALSVGLLGFSLGALLKLVH